MQPTCPTLVIVLLSIVLNIVEYLVLFSFDYFALGRLGRGIESDVGRVFPLKSFKNILHVFVIVNILKNEILTSNVVNLSLIEMR